MGTLKDWIGILLLLLPGGAAARGSYCLIKMQMDSEQSGIYRRRLVNLLTFTVIAVCILGVLYCVAAYLGY